MWTHDDPDGVIGSIDPRYELTMDELYYHYDTLRRLSSLPLNQVIYIQATLCLERCQMLYHRLVHFANTPAQKKDAYKAYQFCVRQCGWR